MARKKGTPQKAPEYKKKAPGKAKDGSTCYTRQGNKGAYVTCTGTQKSSAKPKAAAKPKAKPKSTIGGRPAGLKVKVGTLNKGKPPTKGRAKPKAKPKVDKETLQKVMGVMAEVGKSKGKSDSGQIKDRARWAKQDEEVKKRGIVVGAEIFLGQKVAKKFGKLTIDDTSSWVTFNRKGGDGYEDLGSIDFKDVKLNAKGVITGRAAKVYNGSASWSEAGF